MNQTTEGGNPQFLSDLNDLLQLVGRHRSGEKASLLQQHKTVLIPSQGSRRYHCTPAHSVLLSESVPSSVPGARFCPAKTVRPAKDSESPRRLENPGAGRTIARKVVGSETRRCVGHK